jgi:hypothetical protein
LIPEFATIAAIVESGLDSNGWVRRLAVSGVYLRETLQPARLAFNQVERAKVGEGAPIGSGGIKKKIKGSSVTAAFSTTRTANGAYTISFKSGFRGIAQGIEVANDRYADGPALLRQRAGANPDRHYLGFGMEVPSWFREAWSSCPPPTDEERAYFDANMPDDMKKTVQGARLDALCFVKTDNEQRIPRGALYSAPKI